MRARDAAYWNYRMYFYKYVAATRQITIVNSPLPSTPKQLARRAALNI